MEGLFDGRFIDWVDGLGSYLLLLAVDTSIGAALIGNEYGYD
jgi:hypothetical protein